MLFVHGTPDWNLGSRHPIKAFSATYRCVAVDHPGFWISDKPADADCMVAAHTRRLQGLIDKLDLKDLTLVVTDFGGGIGLQHALERPCNVKHVVLYNTWMWDLMPDKRFARPARIMNSWLGRFLLSAHGFTVNMMMPNAYGDKSRLTPRIHAHDKNALPDASSRAANFACVQEMANAGPFWNAQWEQVDRSRNMRVLSCWGMKDGFLPNDLLPWWKQAFPDAAVSAFPHPGKSCKGKRTRSWWPRCGRSSPGSTTSHQAHVGCQVSRTPMCMIHGPHMWS